IVAVPSMPKFKNPEDWCFQCPRYLTYQVYEWDRVHQRMVHRGTIPHTNEGHDIDGDPFQDERRYLLQHLRRMFPPRRFRGRTPADVAQWPVQPAFDPARWDVVKTIRADLGPHLHEATIQLLVSKEIIYRWSFYGQSEQHTYRLANVIVQADGRVAYQYDWTPLAYHFGRADNAFFADTDIELRDVTNDGVPEVLFHSADSFLSSPPWTHVLHYDSNETASEPFRDVFLPIWQRDIQKFTWLEASGHTFGVVAIPYDKDHSPAKSHYDVYDWSNGKREFVLRWRIPAPAHAREEGDGLAVAPNYLRAQLLRRIRRRQGRAH
ncbi:MAG: hypothetical protein ACHQ4J_03995, partial [Candidatus Binatia bacterium]